MTVAASPSVRADADVAAVQRRTLRVLLASQVLAGAGLAAGYLVGGAGVVVAAVLDSVPLLLVSLLLYGSGTATNLQARYAGDDLAGGLVALTLVPGLLFSRSRTAAAEPVSAGEPA